jgi:transposase InsO family protein
MNGAAFLREVVAVFPYAIHTVLTDNGMAFADLPQYRDGPTATWMGHIFDRVCREHGIEHSIEHSIEHRLTKPDHPWTNGQAERMNRTVKDATVKVFHYPDLESLKAHVLAFVPGLCSWPLSRPTPSPSPSSGSDGEPPSRPFARPGQTTRDPSKSTRTTSSRDHTPRPFGRI